jgi:hypothetical protein
MEPIWEEYCTAIDGHVALVRVELTAAQDLQRLDAPNLLRVQYLLQKPDGDGLPGEVDARIIHELTAELQDWIGAAGGRFVGEVSAAGQHSWLFYMPCGWVEAANLVHRIGLRKGVALGAEMTPDARHAAYFEELLPSAEELRKTRLARRLAELAARGDDAAQARPVEHTVTFDNRTQALSFAGWARQRGFVVTAMNPPARMGERFELKFHRVMALEPARLEEDIAQVEETAARLGGAYLGWRAEVCLPKSA